MMPHDASVAVVLICVVVLAAAVAYAHGRRVGHRAGFRSGWISAAETGRYCHVCEAIHFDDRYCYRVTPAELGGQSTTPRRRRRQPAG